MPVQTSTIDATSPFAIAPTTASVRANFLAAKNELNQCFINDDAAKTRITALESAPAASAAHAITAARESTQTFTSAVQTKVLFDVLKSGSATDYNAATGEYLCPETGLYLINFAFLIRPSLGSVIVQNTLRVNNVVAREFEAQNGNANSNNPCTRTAAVQLTAGEVLTLWCLASVTSSLTTPGTETWESRNNLQIAKIG